MTTIIKQSKIYGNSDKPAIYDKAYRASFGKFHAHICLLTGVEFAEFSSEGVDGAHITIGRYGRSMKPSDDLILPLRHSLHLMFDRNQRKFVEDHFYEFDVVRITGGEIIVDLDDKIEIIKEIARQYYQAWKARQ